MVVMMACGIVGDILLNDVNAWVAILGDLLVGGGGGRAVAGGECVQAWG